MFFLVASLLISFSLLITKKQVFQNNPDTNFLKISKSIHFPVKEISGISIRKDKNSEINNIYIVGDKLPQLGVANLNKQEKTILQPKLIDFSTSILDRFAVCSSKSIPQCHYMVKTLTSQWEAVFVDSISRAFLLNERLASIIAYSLESNKVLSVINLERFEAEEKTKKQTHAQHYDNGLGEGFVLLNNSHILVIKEKNNSAIIEFGKEGHLSEGYNQKLFLNDELYEISGEKVSLVPLKIWNLPKKDKNCDLSEITTDEIGQLYVLSQNCQTISKLSDLSVHSDFAVYEKQWLLPATIRYAEALAVLEKEQSFVIGIDEKSIQKDNIIFLETNF